MDTKQPVILVSCISGSQKVTRILCIHLHTSAMSFPSILMLYKQALKLTFSVVTLYVKNIDIVINISGRRGFTITNHVMINLYKRPY